MKSRLEALLKEQGFRVTQKRVAVLEFLSTQQHPIGVEVIAKAFPKLNQTTIYRMLNDFVEKGIIVTHQLGHGHVDYQLVMDGKHHHHAVCKACGHIEKVHVCIEDCDLVKNILKATKNFTNIESQATTFFGTCKSCK